MPQQNVLDLRGSDVLRAADDRVVGTPADEQVAILVEVAVVPGIEEAASVDGAPQARVLGGHLFAAHADPAGLAGPEDLAAWAADFEFDTRQRPADRGQARPHGRPRGFQRGAMILRSEQRDGRTGLGEPVRVDEIDVRPFPQCPLDERGRHRGAAVGKRAQRRHGPVLVGVDDPGEHRRDHHRAGDLFLPHDPKPLTRGESLEHEGAAAGVQIADHVRHGRNVVRRNADEGRFLFSGRGELHRAQHVGDQVLVAEQHSLGLRRGAAGVDDDGRCVLAGRDVVDLAAVGARLRQPGVGGHRVDSGSLKVRERIGSRNPERLLVPGEQAVQLPLPQPVVERDERHPCPRRGEERDREGGTVHVQVDDGLGSALAQQPGPGVRSLGKLGRGHPAGLAPGQDALAEPVGGHVKQQRQTHR